MRIELKKFVHMKSLSEETLCYTADVYVDGKLYARVENRGRGGATTVFVEPSMRAMEQSVNNYCQSLPPVVAYGYTLNMDFESYVDDLASRQVAAKELKPLLKRKILAIKPNDGMYEYKVSGNKVTQEVIAIFQNQNPTFAVLNTMDFDKALDAFLKL
jgi:hypothetical protein